MGNQPTKKTGSANSNPKISTSNESSGTFETDASSDSATIHSSNSDRAFVSSFELAFDDFTLLEPPLGHSPCGTSYKAYWNKLNGEQQEVLVKFYAQPRYANNEDVTDFAEAFANQVSSMGILPPHENLVRFYGAWAKPKPAIVTELMAQSLHDALVQGKFDNSLESVLRTALQIARGMEHLHKNDILHLSLKGKNIMLDAKGHHVKICDYGTAEWRQDFNGLQYMSPELVNLESQGQVSKAADVYSFAILMFEILTGKPLPNVDATTDRSLLATAASLRPSMKDFVSTSDNANNAKIIEQLYVALMNDCMNENPAKRPKFTEIVISLERLLEIQRNPSSASDLAAIATGKSKDLYRSVFAIPSNTIYGRDIELQIVKDLFQSNSAGKSGGAGNLCIFIGGVSGIGKSAFVRKAFHDLTQALNKEQYSFHSGKYDQLKNAPYAAILSCFQSVINSRVIAPSQANPKTKKNWKKLLNKALGKNGQLITDVLPGLVEIVGEQKPVAELSGEEAITRFTETFSSFVEVLATPQHKLVLFIDDIQWADAASLKLLEALLRNPHVLFIGAFRNNEITPGHPLITTQANIKKLGIKIHEITLVPPSVNEMNRLTQDVFHCKAEVAMPLTQLIYEKTQGNCFFFVQYLSSLHASNIITYSMSEQKWVWDLDEIQEKGFPSNIVDFMLAKLKQQLSKKSQYILQLASCLGSTFHLNQLCAMAEKVPIGDGAPIGFINESDLQELLVNNYIRKATVNAPKATTAPSLDFGDNGYGSHAAADMRNISYSFAHDRIQQSAYSLFKGQKVGVKQVHKAIGMLLLQNAEQFDNVANSIFNIVTNLNLSVELFTDLDELFKVAQLNMAASQQSTKAVDYQSSLKYAQAAFRILFEFIAPMKSRSEGSTNNNDNSDDVEACVWKDDKYYSFALQLCMALQRLEYINKNFEGGELYFAKMKKYARNSAELCPAYYEKTRILELDMKYADVIATGIECLHVNNEVEAANNWLNATDAQIEALYRKIKRSLEENDFAQLKNMTQLRGTATVELISYDMLQTAASVAMMVNQTFYGAFRMTEICLDNDIVQNTSFNAWCLFALMVVNRFRDYKLGRTIVETINKHTEGVLERLEYADLYTTFCKMWSSPLQEVIKRAHVYNTKLAKSEGNMKLFVYQFAKTMVTDTLICTNVVAHMQKWNNVYKAVAAANSTIAVAIRPPIALSILSDQLDPKHAAEYEAIMLHIPSPIIHMYFYVIKALATTVLEQTDEAFRCLTKGVFPNLSIIFADTCVESVAHTLDVLVRCKLISAARATTPTQSQAEVAVTVEEHLKVIDEKIALLKIFAEEALESNFAFYYHFALAERARVEANSGNEDTILKEYQAAVQLAKAGQFWFETIILERLAGYCAEKGMTDLFLKYVNEAYLAYSQFGATNKLPLLKAKYGEKVFAAQEALLEEKASMASAKVSLHVIVHNNDCKAIRDFITKNGTSGLLEQSYEGSGSRNTPLHIAASNGHAEAIVALLDTLAISSPVREKALNAMWNVHGYLPLHLAIRNEHFAAADALLKEGADINARTKKEHSGTALHDCCKHGAVRACKFLLERMTVKDIMTRNKAGDTALISAAKSNKTEIVKLFIDHFEQEASKTGESDILAGVLSYKDSRGYNLFHIAVEHKSVALVKTLISSLHQPNKPAYDTLCLSMLGTRERRQQLTPFLFAIMSSFSTQLPQHKLIVEEMLKYLMSQRQHHEHYVQVYAIVNAADANNMDTPLHVALQRKDAELAHALLALGASVNLMNKNRDTPHSLSKKLGIKLHTPISINNNNNNNNSSSSSNNNDGTGSPVKHSFFKAPRNTNSSSTGNNNNSAAAAAAAASTTTTTTTTITKKQQTPSDIGTSTDNKTTTGTTTTTTTTLSFEDIDFEEFMQDELLRPFLRRLCEKEFSVENYDFLIEVEEYSKIDSAQERRHRAQQMYAKYVAQQAEMMLNIEDYLRREIKIALAAHKPTASTASATTTTTATANEPAATTAPTSPKLMGCPADDHPPRDLFDKISREARVTLMDTYTRFVRHELGRECLALKQSLLNQSQKQHNKHSSLSITPTTSGLLQTSILLHDQRRSRDM